MKKCFFLSLLLCLPLLSFAGNFSLQTGTDATYTDNAFQLSDHDLDRFDDDNSALSYIETSDDFILKPYLKAMYDTKWAGLQISPSMKGQWQQYCSNTDKSKYYLLSSIDFSKKQWDLNLTYGYYPNNYLRQYKDTDGTGSLEKYEYDKNLYKAEVGYSPITKIKLMGYYKYEQYYYNEYWKEYDGDATTIGAGVRFSLPAWYLTGWYYYRDLTTDGTPSSSAEEASSDASYESNLYSFTLQAKKIYLNKKQAIRPTFSFDIDQRYYQGNDSFHAGREDMTYTLGAGVTYYVTRNLDISLDYSHLFRNVSSDNSTVALYKEYTENQITVGANYQMSFSKKRSKRS